MKKASKVLIGVLSVGALIGTGFAAWTINKGYTKAEAPGFTPDVIVNNNSSFGKFIVTQVEEKNEAGETVSPIKFDAPREVYNNGQKLPFDPGEEDLEVTYNLRAESDNGHPVDPYTLGIVNRHAYDGIATEYIPDVSISTKVVDAQKQEVSAEVLAEIKEYVALPEDVSERQMQIPYEKWLAADKKETGYDHTLRFGWGSLTHGENPQLYFIKEENKVEGKDLSESFEAYINKLNEVVKTSGIQFVFTFEIGGVEIFEANTSLISIVEGLGADLHVTHEGQEVKNGDELEIGSVVNVSASALEGYENPVITFNGKVIEAGEVTIVKGANEFGVTATKVTEPVDEKYYAHVGEAKYELTLDNEGQYTATLPSVKAGDIVNIAQGDQLVPVGTYTPDTWKTNNLVLAEDGKTMLVRQSADNVNIYFKKDKTVWLDGYVAPVDPTEKVITGALNGQSIVLKDVKGAESENKAEYILTLAIGDKVSFKYGDDVLGFYHYDAELQEVVKDGDEFIATIAGEHIFYINSDYQIYVTQPGAPVEEKLTIAKAIEDKNVEDELEINALIVSKNKNGTVVYDGTAVISIFGDKTHNVGDFVNVKGKISLYYNWYQFNNPTISEGVADESLKTKFAEFKRTLSSAELDAWVEAAKAGTPKQLENGVITARVTSFKSGNYINFTLEGSNYPLSVYGNTVAFEDNKQYDLTFLLNNFNNSGSYVSIDLISYELVQEVTPVDPTEEKEFYVVGTMNNWEIKSEYKLSKMEEEKDGKVQYESSLLTLAVDDELKIRAGGDNGDWYGVEGQNYKVTEAGQYKIYFVEEGGIAEWNQVNTGGFYYVAKQESTQPIDPQPSETSLTNTITFVTDSSDSTTAVTTVSDEAYSFSNTENSVLSSITNCTKVYEKSTHGLKFGTSSVGGEATFSFDVGKYDIEKITVSALPFSHAKDTAGKYFLINGAEYALGDGTEAITAEYQFTNDDKTNGQLIMASKVPGNNRFYISSIVVTYKIK